GLRKIQRGGVKRVKKESPVIKMKKLKALWVFVAVFLMCQAVFAQTPDPRGKITFQAVARDSVNRLVVNSQVTVEIEIREQSCNGLIVFHERHNNVPTNQQGLFTLAVGTGTPMHPMAKPGLREIEWNNAWIKTKVDVYGGNNLTLVDCAPISAVPYALQAASAASGHFLTSDSAVITTMQNDIAAAIAKEKTDSNTLASRIDALENASLDCDDVKNCIKDTLSNYTTTTALTDLLREIKDRMDAQDAKIDSLRHLVDSLSGGGDTPDTLDTPTAFTCGTDSVKDVDNNWYHTVKIGNQCWMKENLRTKTHQYGQVWTKTDVDSAIYGRYYDWQAAMQIEQGNSTSYTAGDKHRGICPEGWHVPSHAEWTQLTYYVNTAANGYRCNGDGTIAKALSSPTGWNSNTNEDCNAGNTGDKANATGFSAVPAGHCFDGNFASFGIHACFWSATQKTDYEAWYRYLDSSDSYVYSSSDYKENGFSVRCVRD
ncbi:MAG: fibrobacter succinogenes major paralogous domain-containing protein, partial [Bacteroidales bacterium]|nr:fibrobacter succinogenes major paralogous domain-containing protein [Bacteroidales bacterium]